MRTDLEADFADGRYVFRLTLPGIDEIQRKTGVGLGKLFARILAGRYVDGKGNAFGLPLEAEWGSADLIETIRQGLIGGGKGTVDGSDVSVDMQRANELLRTYVYPARPLREAWDLATAILSAAIEGIENDMHPVKKKSRSARTPKAGSTSSER